MAQDRKYKTKNSNYRPGTPGATTTSNKGWHQPKQLSDIKDVDKIRELSKKNTGYIKKQEINKK